MGWPKIIWNEEGMREGMQIESATIPVDKKIELLDALSETGLKRIVIGSFVSPKYTPQMARIDEIVTKFHPKPGVTYTALALNQKGIERARQYSPPLTLERPIPTLMCHMCDVFVRRNANVSQQQEIDRWPLIVAAAKERGVKEGGIGLGAAWGSNFTGPVSEAQRMEMLWRQYRLWEAAGIPVTYLSFADPMSWNMPHVVEQQIETIRKTWPSIKTIHLHLHDGRGMAPISVYSAMRVMDESMTLSLDGTIGAMGGCPYCGNGQITRMAATEDMHHMFLEMGIDLGIDFDKLIRAVWLAEEVVGHKLWGHVSKAGPFPKKVRAFYSPDLPFIETEEQAKHFLLGDSVIGEAISPWKEPIISPQREAIEAAATVKGSL